MFYFHFVFCWKSVVEMVSSSSSQLSNIINEVRQREAKQAETAALQSEKDYLKNPRSLFAAFSVEQLQTSLLPKWRDAELVQDVNSGAGIDRASFVSLTLECVRDRFPALEQVGTVTQMLCDFFDKVDAAGVGRITWHTFWSYLMDTVDEAFTANTEAASTAEYSLRIASSRNLNFISGTLEFIHRIVMLDPHHCMACLTRVGVIHVVTWPDFVVQRTTRLRCVVTAVTYVRERQLLQSVPGIFAFRSFLVVATSNMRLSMFPAKDFELRRFCPITDTVGCLAFCHSDQLLYGGTRDGCLVSWDVCPKGFITPRRRIQIHTDVITDFLFVPGWILSASADTTVVQTPTDSDDHGVARRSIVFHGHQCSVTSVTYSDTLKLIVTLGADNACLCFVEGFPSVPPLRIGDEAATSKSPLAYLGVHHGGASLITVDKANVIKVWDLRSLRCSHTHTIVPAVQSHAVNTLCACGVASQPSDSRSDSVLVNTNFQMYEVEVTSVEKTAAGLLFEDNDPVFHAQPHPTLPRCLVAVAQCGVVLFDLAAKRRLATHTDVLLSVSAACIDPSGSRIALGSATGEMAVYRLDTGRVIRRYALPSNCGEVLGIVYAHDERVITAITELGQFIVCLDNGGSSEIGTCGILRSVKMPHPLHNVQSCVYSQIVGLDSAQRVRVLLTDSADMQSQVLPCAAEGVALCSLRPYPCVAVSTNDAYVTMWALKPHALSGSILCRFRNDTRQTSASEASSSRKDSKCGTRNSVVVSIAWIHPYTLACCDELNFLSLWDVSDVVLQCRLLDASIRGIYGASQGNTIQKCGEAKAAPKRSFFHCVPRPPVVRRVHQLKLSHIATSVTFFPPKYLVTVDDTSSPNTFVISCCGMEEVASIDPATPYCRTKETHAATRYTHRPLWGRTCSLLRACWLLTKFLGASQASCKVRTQRHPFITCDAVTVDASRDPNGTVSFLLLSLPHGLCRALAGDATDEQVEAAEDLPPSPHRCLRTVRPRGIVSSAATPQEQLREALRRAKSIELTKRREFAQEADSIIKVNQAHVNRVALRRVFADVCLKKEVVLSGDCRILKATLKRDCSPPQPNKSATPLSPNPARPRPASACSTTQQRRLTSSAVERHVPYVSSFGRVTSPPISDCDVTLHMSSCQQSPPSRPASAGNARRVWNAVQEANSLQKYRSAAAIQCGVSHFSRKDSRVGT